MCQCFINYYVLNFLQLVCSQVKKLVVVLLNVDTNEVLERWEFNIEVEDGDDDPEAAKENAGDNKDKKEKAAAKAPKDLAKIKQGRCCCSKILVLSSALSILNLWQGCVHGETYDSVVVISFGNIVYKAIALLFI